MDSLEALVVARSIQADIAGVERLANISKLLLELFLALTWQAQPWWSTGCAPTRMEAALTSRDLVAEAEEGIFGTGIAPPVIGILRYLVRHLEA